MLKCQRLSSHTEHKPLLLIAFYRKFAAASETLKLEHVCTYSKRAST